MKTILRGIAVFVGGTAFLFAQQDLTVQWKLTLSDLRADWDRLRRHAAVFVAVRFASRINPWNFPMSETGASGTTIKASVFEEELTNLARLTSNLEAKLRRLQGRKHRQVGVANCRYLVAEVPSIRQLPVSRHGFHLIDRVSC